MRMGGVGQDWRVGRNGALGSRRKELSCLDWRSCACAQAGGESWLFRVSMTDCVPSSVLEPTLLRAGCIPVRAVSNKVTP